MKPGIQLATCLLGLATLAGATDPTAPTFFARRDYTGLNAGWVQVADTNGDGVPDLIAALSNYIQVLFGNGDGTFGPAGANTGTNGGGDSFVAADVNGDGIVDIVQPGDNSQNQSGMGVCLGNGDGTFQKGTFYPVADNGPGFLGSVVIGDFNGDGILDVAGAGGSGIWLWTGKGGGLFNAGVLAVPLSTGGGSIAATDFSGNGKLDIVATMAQSFAVLLGNGNGTFQAPKVFSLPSFPSGLALGALTKGGHPSIAVSTGSDAYLYFGNGAGGFAGPRVVSLPSSSRGVAIGDLNNDGIPDLVSPGGYIAFGTGAGEFKPALAYPVENLEGDFRNVVLADLRGNGMTDIVTDDVFGVSALLNLGIGKFEDGIWTRVNRRLGLRRRCGLQRRR
jgi:hypothetical protein